MIDKDTVFDGRNKRAVVVTGKSVKVDILDGTTTTARRDATSILAKRGNVTFDIAGKLIADGDDATVVDIEGHNSRVTLQKTGSVLSTNSADGVEISGQNTRVDILGTVSVTGTDSTGIDIEGNNASLTIDRDARLSVQSSGNAWEKIASPFCLMLKVIISVSFRPASISVSASMVPALMLKQKMVEKFSRPAG